MKKFLSVLLAAIMVVVCCVPAFAAESLYPLQFNKDGDFKILHITDCQDEYPASETMLQFIEHCLKKYDPDLVVLGGDNTVDGRGKQEQAVAQIVELFVKYETYFTLVFGNHDREYGPVEEQIKHNAELLGYYQKHGGKYCLANDIFPELTGVGTHCLPVLSKDGKNVAYNLFMFDSGTSGYKDPAISEEVGYDCVHPDQIEWYKTISKAANVPSMAFQHIIVGEIMDVFYKEKKDVAISFDSKFCNGKEYDLTVADFSAIKDGMLLEPPCPGVVNYGQFDALVECGTVAVFSGHDHVNTFTVEYKGVDIVNTPGCTFNSYGQDYNRGARLITIHDDTKAYDSEVILLAEEAMDSEFIELNFFSKIFGIMINKIILAFFDLF